MAAVSTMTAPEVDPNYQNISSCDQVGHQHQWPTTGYIIIERCEHYCLFCKGSKAQHRWSSAWFLRRHVRDYHVKHDYPNLIVSDGWKARPLGNSRPLNKKKRAPGSNKKRAGTKKEHAARMREVQTALCNSIIDINNNNSPVSNAVTTINSSDLGSASISTGTLVFEAQPACSALQPEFQSAATVANPYPFEFGQNDFDILTHIGAFIQPEASAYQVYNMFSSEPSTVASTPAQSDFTTSAHAIPAQPSAEFTTPLFAEQTPLVIDPTMLSNTPVEQSTEASIAEFNNTVDEFINFTIDDTTIPFPPFSQEIADTIDFEGYLNDEFDISNVPPPAIWSGQFRDFDNTFLPPFEGGWN